MFMNIYIWFGKVVSMYDWNEMNLWMCFLFPVTATDRDSATNSQLTYYVDSRTTEFTVESRNNIGFIKTSK